MTGEGQFSDAAHFLNLSDLAADSRAQEGAELARQLALVIERQLWIDWAGVSARPDAMVETGAA